MKDKSLIKTIIICVSAIICVSIASYAYREANRYYFNQGYTMVDKYTKDVYLIDMESKCYRR